MKNCKLLSLGLLSSLIGASSLFATAGAGDVDIFLTRGTNSTTATGFFTTAGGSIFTERVIEGLDGIDAMDSDSVERCDPLTGYNVDATTASYVSDGSLNLHIGYKNSGYVGAGTSVQAFDLNGNLTVGKITYENAYSSNTTFNANNITTISAGESDYKLTIYSRGLAGSGLNLATYRETANSNSATFILDANIDLNIQGQAATSAATKIAGAFAVRNNTLQIGTESGKKRTITVTADSTNFLRIFFGYVGSTINNYADINVVSGATVDRIYDAATVTQYGNVDIKGNTLMFAYNNSGDAVTNLNVKGNVSVNNSTMTNFVHFNNAASAVKSRAVFDGTVDVVSNATSTFRLVLLGNTTKANNTRNSSNYVQFNEKVSVSGSNLANLVYMAEGATTAVTSTSYVEFNKDVTINSASSSFVLLYLRSAGQSVTFNGDVTIGAINSSFLWGNVVGGTVINYNGTLKNTSTASDCALNAGVWNASTGADSAIANFRGTESNSFTRFSLRYGVLNLLKTNGATALKYSGTTGTLNMGASSTVNVFGQNQMDLSNVTINAWGPDLEFISGTINLNGTSATLRGITLTSTKRQIIIDFGMDKSRMTAAQAAEQGITADMINETGAGVAQVFTFKGDVLTTANVSTNYVHIKNYIVGEDKLICEVQLSALGFHSETILDQNFFRFDLGDDSLVYGTDYWVEEEVYAGGGWEYKLVLVPEPAEVAALIGLMALCFAMYRRRR